MAFSESELTMADRRLARARECFERQRETIEKLAAAHQDTTSAEAVLKAMRRTIARLEDDRRVIEDEWFAARAVRA